METPLFQSFLRQFYDTDSGKNFWEMEKVLVNQSIRHVFGYHCLQIGLTGDYNLLENTRVSFKTLVDHAAVENQENAFDAQVVANLDYLPFKKDVFDLVCLPHTLEAVEDPYHVLREADALIVPDGVLLITGFNPLGCAVLQQKFKYRQPHNRFKHAQLIHPKRLIDWLKLLGYDIEYIALSPMTCRMNKTEQAGTVFKKIGQFLSFVGLETGNVYVIQARKKVSSPTPVGLNWKFSQLLPLRRGRTVAASQVTHKMKEKKQNEAS